MSKNKKKTKINLIINNKTQKKNKYIAILPSKLRTKATNLTKQATLIF